jgi:hypothetical protein
MNRRTGKRKRRMADQEPQPTKHTSNPADEKQQGTGNPSSESARPRSEKHAPESAAKNSKPNAGNKHWLEYLTAGLAFIAAIGGIAAAVAGGYQGWVARNAEQRQLRAYVGIDKIELINDPSIQNGSIAEGQAGYVFPDYLTVTMKNFGVTTAFYVSDYINFGLFPFGTQAPSDFAFADFPESFPANQPHPNIGSTTLDRDQMYPGKHALRKRSVQEFKIAGRKEQVLYLWGHINYCDIYNRKWIRNFAFIYEPWLGVGHEFESINRHQGEHQDGNCE